MVEQAGFWDIHTTLAGMALLLGLAFVPRITTALMLIFSGFVSGGVFWWLGWFFVPHFLVAFLATWAYWETNPGLVVGSWIWALLGTGGEASATRRKRDE